MNVRIRKQNKDGLVRLQTSGAVKEVLINEDLIHPNEESISICFRGKDSSGIVDFSPDEIEALYRSVRSRMHLVKGLKQLYGSGAIKAKKGQNYTEVL